MTEDETTPLAALVERHGSARRPQVRPRPRPEGMSDDAVAALGKLSAALEVAEDARGHLYAFHRLSGRADLDLQDAVRSLRDAGLAEIAQVIDEVLVGRDVVGEAWTFELVEAYDDQYLEVFRDVERTARRSAGLEARHVFESEMKAAEQHDGTS